MAKKALYHQELVKMGDVQVYVDSDPIESTYKRGSKFVALKIANEDRTYTPELVACAEAFRGYKGQTVTVRASGSDYQGATDARIELFGAQRSAPPQSQPQQRNAPPPQQQTAAANPGQNQRMPIHGPTVGMAVKTTCDFLMANGKELNFENIWPIASTIIRTVRYMEAGYLAPKPGKAAASTPPPTQQPPPTPPPQPAPPPQQQSAEQPPLPEDDVPF